MKKIIFLFLPALFAGMVSCKQEQKGTGNQQDSLKTEDNFQYISEQFADLRILRYPVHGFEELSLKQKEMLYYLYQAALSGRDILWAQNCKYNLAVRHTLEAIVNSGKVDTTSDEGRKFMVYAKRVWFSNGIHHHYGNSKMIPECSQAYFASLIKGSDAKELPIQNKETVEAFIKRISPIIFDPNILPKKVNKDASLDMIKASATGYYDGVSQKEVTDFYSSMANKKDSMPPMYGLNSTVVKENGKIVEKVWKVGGMYGEAISKIVSWLEKASAVAENEAQKKALDLLIEYYKTGDLKKFDEYSIAWVADSVSRIDLTNGFIEVYGDPLGYKGAYESVVSIRDMEATKRIAAIGGNAQWFEDNSPIMSQHKKKNVKGISAKVITVVMEAGDASPATPIGINLPNSNWIREQHGSKSVNLSNIVESYNKAKGEGTLNEFYFTEEMKDRARKFGVLADNLETDMHEVIGHASGTLNPGIAEPHQTLKNYASTLEEGRADLVGLYYLMDQKLIDMGVMPSFDVGKAQYDYYIMNGMMTQLRRIKMGDQIEEDHMRNRQMNAMWCYEKGKKDNVIEKKIKDGKTFIVINDYTKLRALFGELLKELQRIKSEGDYQAGHDLVENYGVKVDKALHAEVLERYKKLNIPAYQGFINPKLVPVMEGEKIKDMQVEYPTDFTKQMLEYGKFYGFLPVNN